MIFHSNDFRLTANSKTGQDCLWIGVRLLPVNAPITQFLEWDWLAGNRATHEGARSADAEIAVEILDLRFGRAKISIHPIHLKSLAATAPRAVELTTLIWAA